MAKDILGASIIYRLSGGKIRFVLIQDRFGKWTFPKGKSRKEEKPEITAIREGMF